MNIRPMLAASFDNPQEFEEELERLRYPLLCSPKIDGIRWMKPPGEKAKSRSWKDLPNRAFQAFMEEHSKYVDWLDGEVITGDDITRPNLFNATQSHIMTADADLPFTVYVFDSWIVTTNPFGVRTACARAIADTANAGGIATIKYVHHLIANSPNEVLQLEAQVLEEGYEGLMLRDPNGLYKFGRSTLKQQGLIKCKRFLDDEAEIIGFEALERNLNAPTLDAFGLQKRSSHRVNKIADNLLGKLLVRHERFGEFAIGSGFDESTRIKIWLDQQTYIGKKVSFKYQPHGTKEKPRTPIFKGFRPEID